jgi:hypothetical protein
MVDALVLGTASLVALWKPGVYVQQGVKDIGHSRPAGLGPLAVVDVVEAMINVRVGT